MGFQPSEVLFSPTTACNLNCPHCAVMRSRKTLSILSAKRFIDACEAAGIRRIGFTGGEPFLAQDFLCALSGKAVEKNMLFDRIVTNGVWYNNQDKLKRTLARLYKAGYDGEICVSIDAFHRQNLNKAARFIKTVLSTWQRKDVVSIACVVGSRETATENKLRALARLLNARLTGFRGSHPRIKNGSLFIKIFKIDLSAAGKAAKLKNGWDGKWFKEDHCEGPGNAFFVLPDGSVKPCCGYACEDEELTIGNIYKDSPKDLIKRSKTKAFVKTVFGSGLTNIRKRLEVSGIKFPGRTSSSCFFCHYILTMVPKTILREAI